MLDVVNLVVVNTSTNTLGLGLGLQIITNRRGCLHLLVFRLPHEYLVDVTTT